MAASAPLVTAYPPTPKRTHTGESKRSSQLTPKIDDSEARRTSSDIDAARRRSRGLTQSHRKLVFTDPVAFRYLEEDDTTIVLDRRRRLEGYELYVVEQWVCSRVHSTFVVCTYTGDPTHSVLVSVLAIPIDESVWSRRLRTYMEALSQPHAREKETPMGMIMVTNLSNFPSNLNVIAVPQGDIKKHRDDFIVNENLKRMGCAGRAAMNLQHPQQTTVNKFHQLFRTSERIPLYASVIEIVRICQVALVLYDKLKPIYADGLLCDMTQQSIGDWWNDIGTDFHNVEPTDGNMGPTTVSALLGLLIGAYNRLRETGAPVGKDPLDVSSMKKAVSNFQKAQKMERTRRLDRATLDKLHRVTAKSANDDGFALPRAIKSTVSELSGKGGEMLARGFGGGKEKAGISEIETLDIDRLARLVPGSRMKWLWQGKEMKHHSNELYGLSTDGINGRVYGTDEQGNFLWTGDNYGLAGDDADEASTEPESRKHSRMRSNIGLPVIKSRDSRSAFPDLELHNDLSSHEPPTIPALGRVSKEYARASSTSPSSIRGQPQLGLSLANASGKDMETPTTPLGSEKNETRPARPRAITNNHREVLRGIDHQTADRDSPGKRRVREQLASIRADLQKDTYKNFTSDIDLKQIETRALRRSQSSVQLREMWNARQARLPRHLSFSLVAESIFRRETAAATAGSTAGLDSESDQDDITDNEDADPKSRIAARKQQLTNAQHLTSHILRIQRGLVPFVTTRVTDVESLDAEGHSHLDELNSSYYQRLEDYQTLQATSTDLVAREKSALNDGLRRIDMLGNKLDYELNSLNSRMQEVEDGVEEFERNVLEIETSVKLLVAQKDDQVVPWYKRLFGFGVSQTQEKHS